MQVCAVFACTDNTLASCGRRFGSDIPFEEKVQFDYIKVETVLRAKSKAHMMPNTLDTSLLPLNPSEFNYVEIREFDDDE